MTRKTTESHAGRQLDLEVLSHVEKMLPLQRVYPRVDDTPRVVAGIQKAVQRHVKLFLTSLGSMKLEPERGGTLLQDIRKGQINDTVSLKAACGAANAEALSMIRRDDSNTNVFGPIPDDERLVDVSITDASIDRASQTIHVTLTYTTAAGDGFTFVIPVASI